MHDTPRVTIDTPVIFRDDLPESVDVAIIGGGVIGVFAALYLTRMGKRVFLCEKGRIAGEQSSRNWGWIRQQGRDAAELPIMMHAMKLWESIDKEVGGQCGVTTGGTYYLDSTEAGLARIIHRMFWSRGFCARKRVHICRGKRVCCAGFPALAFEFACFSFGVTGRCAA